MPARRPLTKSASFLKGLRTIGGQRSEFSLVVGAIREGFLAEVTLEAPGSLKGTSAKCFLFRSLAGGGLTH